MATHPILEIWIAELDSIRDFPRAVLELLEESEFEKLSQFREKSNRRRYLLSRILLRKAVARRLGQPLRGAPSSAGFEYSLSYSGNLVVLAISDSCKLGVDVEWVDRQIFSGPGGERWLDSVLTPREREGLSGFHDDARWVESLRLWTIKEAYAKFLGVGNPVEFPDFEIEPGSRTIHHPIQGANFAEGIRIESREIALRSERYHIALAARPLKGSVPPLSLFRVDHLEPLEISPYDIPPRREPSPSGHPAATGIPML